MVNFCSSRIFESLSEDNALEIGMFGEMHNSEVLINRCAKYICYDMTDSLAEDWMDRIKERDIENEAIRIGTDFIERWRPIITRENCYIEF